MPTELAWMAKIPQLCHCLLFYIDRFLNVSLLHCDVGPNLSWLVVLTRSKSISPDDHLVSLSRGIWL